MSDASALLKERSRSYLLDLSLQIEHDLANENASPVELEQTLELGRAQFTQINALLKATLDAADLPSFTEAEREWAKMFDDLYFPDDNGDIEALEGEVLPGEATPEVRRLARYRQVLRLGLAMWATHLYGKPDREHADDVPLGALQILSHRFDDIEALFDVFERASEEDVEDKLPWTSWFLAELPTREAHFIPTRRELLFTTALFTTALAATEPPTLAPRQWLAWQFDDITVALDRLDSEAERWSQLMPAPPDTEANLNPDDPLRWWHDRVARAREIFTQAKRDTEADESAKVRDAAIDPERVDAFRSSLLIKTRESRLVRDIFVVQGGFERLPAPPEDHDSLVAHSWMPKSSFMQDSRVVGLEMSAGDIGRDTIREETTQLLKVLDGTGDPRSIKQEITAEVRQAVQDLRQSGWRPSLIVIPSGWALEQSLGLRRWPKLSDPHPLIPLLRLRDFAGILHGVPVIAFPRAPKDRLRIVDLAAAVRYREWQSDEDSGIQFEFKSFDTDAAQQMLAEHPEVRAEGLSDEQAINELRERVLVSLKLCWDIRPGDPDATISIAIPLDLQR